MAKMGPWYLASFNPRPMRGDSMKIKSTVLGLPKGGTEGQVLIKKSDMDGDSEWIDHEFIINATITYSYDTQEYTLESVDKTNEEILAAYTSGKRLKTVVNLEHNNSTVFLDLASVYCMGTIYHLTFSKAYTEENMYLKCVRLRFMNVQNAGSPNVDMYIGYIGATRLVIEDLDGDENTDVLVVTVEEQLDTDTDYTIPVKYNWYDGKLYVPASIVK